MATPIINSVTPNGGTEGTQITINGSNFEAVQGTGKVIFDINGTPLDQTSTSSWSDTQIITTVPGPLGPNGKGLHFVVQNDSGDTSDDKYFYMESDDIFADSLDYQIPGENAVEDVNNQKVDLAEAGDANYWNQSVRKFRDILKGSDELPSRIIEKGEQSISDGDTSPDIISGSYYVTANTSPTTITEFNNPPSSGAQIIRIRVDDSNTTFEHNNGGATYPLILISGSNIAAQSGEIYTFEFRNGQWYNTNIHTTNLAKTLDDAYDSGGSGAGRTITVDGGAVELDNRQTSGDILEISVGGATTLSGTLNGINIDLDTNVTPSGQERFAVKAVGGYISSPGSGTDSERFGEQSIADGTRSVASGFNAQAHKDQDLVYGSNSSTDTDVSSNDNIIVGSNSNLSAIGTNNTLIGNDNTISSNSSNLKILSNSYEEPTGGLSNAFVCGSKDDPINNVYFGAGPISSAASGTEDFTIKGTDYAGSTDSIKATTITIEPGSHSNGSAGAAEGGDLILKGGVADEATTVNNTAGKVKIINGKAANSLGSNNDGSIQLLKSDGTTKVIETNDTGLGFFGKTPVAQPATYTINNTDVRRTIDGSTATVDHILDFVATIAQDLKTLGLLGN